LQRSGRKRLFEVKRVAARALDALDAVEAKLKEKNLEGQQ
jgi:hypothetical protein